MPFSSNSKLEESGLEKELPSYAAGPRRSKGRLWLIGAIILVIALAIGLGVGLGVTLNRNSDNSDDSDDSDSSISEPSTNGTVTNRTFWQPAVNSTWQIVLQNAIDLDANATQTTPDVEVWDIDLFTNSQSTIELLHALDKKVICYFSAGTYESYRPDSSDFNPSDKGDELDGWPGEYWLETSSTNVRKIMAARIELASNKGCDAIDPDNVDGFVWRPSRTTLVPMLTCVQTNVNGLGLTEAGAINYMQFLSEQALSYNMSIGLKNAGDIIDSVLNVTFFSVNEQCVKYEECTTYAPFITAGKPVFHIEYPSGAPDSVNSSTMDSLCSTSGAAAGSEDFSTVIKDMDLDGWVEYCDLTIATSPVED